MTDEEIAAFQAALLEVLAASADPEEVRDRLAARPEAAPFLPWLGSADPAMIGVAQDLVRRWGQTDG